MAADGLVASITREKGGDLELMQYFKFYDLRTGMTERQAVVIPNSGFKITMGFSADFKTLKVTKVAQANNNASAGVISTADSAEQSVAIK